MSKNFNEIKDKGSSGFSNDFSWSLSRDGVFKECKRKYFYDYYGYWEGWKSDAPELTRKIYVLKNLSNRFVWIGSLVHRIVRDLIFQKRARVPVNLSNVLRKLNKKLSEEFQFSKDKKYWIYSKKGGLIEHEYQWNVDSDDWEDLFELAKKCIVNFYNSEVFNTISKINPKQMLFIEDLLNFNLDDINVLLSVDFSYRLNESENLMKKKVSKIVVYDWKTGLMREDNGFDFQLALYSFYLMKKFNLSFEDIIALKYNLRYNVIEKYSVDKEKMDFVRNYVKRSANAMLSLLRDKKNNEAVIDDFPKTSDEDVCSKCKYRKICYPDDY
ncbi:MAG: hypothetical protein GWP09_00370 [Nitrospiraceae bacterium]|nr:hypothetical protein [Nitrospiraceae bacterium]